MKIGIIGAMSVEVEALKAKLEDSHTETVSGIEFYCGRLFGKRMTVLRERKPWVPALIRKGEVYSQGNKTNRG